MNTENFIAQPDKGGGGGARDYFEGRDAAFVAHQQQLLTDLESVSERIEASPGVGVDYAHVTLQTDAWAKSNRPTTQVFPQDKIPVIGGDRLGEMIVELTAENLPAVIQAAFEK